MIFRRRRIEALKDKLQEPMPLPLGMAEFHEWSERIIAGAMIPGGKAESQKYVLARMVMDLKPTVAFESDAFFINSLRKAAANQVADGFMKELYAAKQARLKAEEEAKQNQGEATPPAGTDAKVLDVATVPGTQS